MVEKNKQFNTREKLVKEFHETFNHPVRQIPTLLDAARLEKRIDWMKEEIDELRVANAEKDMVEVLDALIDLQYFLSGTIVEFGLSQSFDAGFADVHISNMSKACFNEKQARETVESYKKQKIVTHAEHNKGVYIIKRSKDGKVLKNVHWSKPRLGTILKNTFGDLIDDNYVSK